MELRKKNKKILLHQCKVKSHQEWNERNGTEQQKKIVQTIY